MTTLSENKPLNRQEFSYYLLFAVLLLFLILITALSLYYALPRYNNVRVRAPIGAVTDFPSTERPYAVTIDGVSLFIVRTETGWLALDRVTPFTWLAGGCYYGWTEANERFEDPCSGSKFALDGRLLDGPATQDLNHYPVFEKSGELFVNLTKLIPGESIR